jgi:hypothetical protein
MAPSAFAFGAVERALTRVLRIDAHQHGAFRGRLKHLQRLGLPALEPGKGKRIGYTRELVLQWLIALLLAQLGIDPVLIVQAIKRDWKAVLAPACADALTRSAQEGNHVYLQLRPRLLTHAGMANAGFEFATFRRFSTAGTGRDHLPDEEEKPYEGVRTWFCVVDLTPFVSQLDMLLPVGS